ncbi:MAG: glycosyltransferase [Flavobacteriaceae bacterium]|nr:glycosyltransferase [Flavobacteriaceae bacterium]
MNQLRPLLSVRFMIFNNEDFIREAIEGILIQKTDFHIEVVVGDDFSTDNTLEIVKSYSNTENITFKILERKPFDSYWKNRKGKGRIYNFIDILNNCEGKYIALLDGDDYWTDPLKLQKQVDFLEGNPEVAISFHRANLLKNQEFSLHPIPEPFEQQRFHYIELLRHYNFISTASVVFRKPEAFNIPKWFYELPFGDLGLYKVITGKNKIQCINEVMSVYRLHSQGIYSGITKLNANKNYLRFYKIILPILNNEEQKVVKYKMNLLIKSISTQKFTGNLLMKKAYNLYLRLKHL